MVRPRSVAPALLALLLPSLLVACGSGTLEAPEPGTGSGHGEGWTRLPDPPLSPRDHAVTVGVGDRMLVVGGWELLCPPDADCVTPEDPLLDDGAVYDAGLDHWTPIAAAPFGVRRHDHAAVAVGGSAFLLDGCASGPRCDAPARLLEYDLDRDRWIDHGTVPGPTNDYSMLVAVGDTVLVHSSSDEQGASVDARYDPATRTWEALPADPLPPVFDRFVVPVGESLVVVGSLEGRPGRGPRRPQARGPPRPGTDALDPPPGRAGGGLPAARERARAAAQRALPRVTGVAARPGDVDLVRPARAVAAGAGPGGRPGPGRGDVRHLEQRGQMASQQRLHVYDSAADAYVTVPPLEGREDVYDDSSAALGRALFVFGGQRWPGQPFPEREPGATGELVGDAWLWTPPEG